MKTIFSAQIDVQGDAETVRAVAEVSAKASAHSAIVVTLMPRAPWIKHTPNAREPYSLARVSGGDYEKAASQIKTLVGQGRLTATEGIDALEYVQDVAALTK